MVIGIDAGDDGGLFLFNKQNPTEKRRFEPKNHPRADASLYYMPSYSKLSHAIGIIAPYQLYVMDVTTQVAELLYDYPLNQIDDYCFYKTQKRILFLRGGRDTQFMSIGIDGKGLKEIKVILK